jgi:galactosylceramidase
MAAASVLLALAALPAVGAVAPAPDAATTINASAPWYRYDGVGGLSGGGATSTFLMAYDEPYRSEIMDWMFKPGFAASLDILKVEIGCDDETTDGCESCHMRSPTDLNCSRGYEWDLMKAATARNPAVAIYGLPWGFAGWLGFGTTNPYHNVTATADYIASWVECGRDTHGVNISVLGLWNEAWQAAGRPDTDPWDYALALRQRLDGSGLGHVRLVAPDGDIGDIVPALKGNATLRQAIWGLGAHYPGVRGADPSWRPDLGMTLWSAEDYSTYSDATGAGCWARLLVQNVGYGYSATISWYLIGSFTRGRHYDSDGLLRAEWPSSGHWEVTPMAWMTMHWTLFAQPGWTVARCATSRCKLAGGGDYAVLVSPDGRDMTVVLETFLHSASTCIRQDPPDWHVAPQQTVTIALPAAVRTTAGAQTLDVWKSCTGWRYPADDDSFMLKQAPLTVSTAGDVTFVAEVNCYYTLTTITGVVKPSVPSTAAADPRPAFFPLPFSEDFEGATAGGEAPYFGDQEGKWETVAAKGGRTGRASQQQLALAAPWPILEPQCNDHGAPVSIIGDMFFESTAVTADLLVGEPGVGAGVALRVRVSSAPKNIRGITPGLFLYLGATPGLVSHGGHDNPGGTAPAPNIHQAGWTLCADSYCSTVLKRGALPSGGGSAVVGHWHTVTLEVTDNLASGRIDASPIFANVSLAPAPPPPPPPPRPPPSAPVVAQCVANTTLQPSSKVIAGGDYRQLVLPPGNSSADIEACNKACCADRQCSAWAIAKDKCWLKNHGWSISTMPGGEAACAIRPHGPTPPPGPPPSSSIPPSGWAGIAATIGLSQADNFRLVGTAPGGSGAAVPPCGPAPPTAGSPVVSTPCDYPSTRARWTVTPVGGTVQLAALPPWRLAAEQDAAEQLCVGAANATHETEPASSASAATLGLVACNSSSALLYSVATGRLSPRGAKGQCATAVQRTWGDAAAPAMTLSACKAAPSETQQFQYNPATGALRPKASVCIATSFQGSTRVAYRDCCIALCPTPA